jgi:hypothetical protein
MYVEYVIKNMKNKQKEHPATNPFLIAQERKIL